MALPSTVAPSMRSLTTSLRAVRFSSAARSFSTSSSVRILSNDGQSRSDATPARVHRRTSPQSRGDHEAEPVTDEPRSSSSGTSGGTRSSADLLADLAQGIGQASSGSLPSRASTSSFLRQSERSSASSTTNDQQTRLSRDPLLAPTEALAPSGYSASSLPLRSDPVLTALVGNMMRDGKKAKAQRQVIDMLKRLSETMHADPLPAVHEAVRLASPMVRMQSRKQGGKVNQVPLPLFPRQARRRGVVAILEASEKRNDNKRCIRLAKEIVAVLDGSSAALSRKLELHRVAAINRSNTGVRV